jgi:hypothetical protein
MSDLSTKIELTIFGRGDAFRFITEELARFKTINLIGERRMGKTSLLKHLVGNQDKHLKPSAHQPPLVLVQIDMQDNISKAEQLYGKALRGLMEALPAHSASSSNGMALIKNGLVEYLMDKNGTKCRSNQISTEMGQECAGRPPR